MSVFWIVSLILIISYVILNIYSAEQTTLPFIIELYYQVLDTFCNIIFFIYDYIPLHILNLILFSIPEPSSIYLTRFKMDISGPFSRLFPTIYNFFTSSFPLFKTNYSAEHLSKMAKIYLKLSVWSLQHQEETLILTYIFIGFLLLLNFYHINKVMNKISKSRFLKILFTIFSTFLIFYKWVSIQGPEYQTIENQLKQVEKFHLISFNKFCNLFKTEKNETENNFKEKASNIFKKSKDFFENLKQTKAENHIMNLDERLSAFYYSLLENNDNFVINKIKSIHPQPFPQLFIYFIYSIFWTVIIFLIVSLLLKICKDDEDDDEQYEIK